MKIKSAFIEITPFQDTHLAGFANRIEKTNDIHSPLEINICLITDSKDTYIFIAIDTLFISESLLTKFNQIIKIHYPTCSEKNVFFCASHTHYAPCIDERMVLGEKDTNYEVHLFKQIDTLFSQLSHLPFEACSIQLSNSKLSGIVSSRRRTLWTLLKKSKIVMEPPFSFAKVSDFYSIDFVSNDKIHTSLINFACHPTNLFSKNKISAEFIHDIRMFKRQNSNNQPVLFLQGFSGDLRASPPSSYSLHRLVYRIFNRSFPLYFIRFNEKQYNAWIQKMMKQISTAKSEITELKPQSAIKSKHVEIDLKELGIETPHAKKLSIKTLEFDTFIILFVSAEVLSSYEEKIQALFKKKVICVGYEGLNFGYLPTYKESIEGGYEADEFFDAFEVKGRWNENFEKIFINAIKDENEGI